MCRFTLYLGEPIRLAALITEPEHSLIYQSYHSEEREEPLNGDGFGLAWYVPEMSPEPGQFRSITPAWSNRNLLSLSRVVQSPCILAHVRAATPGSGVDEANCHPFTRGAYSFMHNGDIGGWTQVRRHLVERLSDESFEGLGGSTDSEHLFALFLDRLRDRGTDPSIDDLALALSQALTETIALAVQHGGGAPSYLNVAVSDGRRAVVTRVTTDPPEDAESLYYWAGARYLCIDGALRLLSTAGQPGAVLVSSERLTDDLGWQPLPPNSMLRIDADRTVTLTPFRPL